VKGWCETERDYQMCRHVQKLHDAPQPLASADAT
jgi:hypothetical protein